MPGGHENPDVRPVCALAVIMPSCRNGLSGPTAPVYLGKALDLTDSGAKPGAPAFRSAW
jgi:hypothetical protein